MTERAFEIVLTPPGRRAIADELPEAVAAAVIDFITRHSFTTRIGSASPFAMT